jgi:hypothetical protein
MCRASATAKFVKTAFEKDFENLYAVSLDRNKLRQ